jgi:hypothetical protein
LRRGRPPSRVKPQDPWFTRLRAMNFRVRAFGLGRGIVLPEYDNSIPEPDEELPDSDLPDAERQAAVERERWRRLSRR